MIQRVGAWRAPRLDAVAVAGPGALALALCLVRLGTRSLWLDETATVSIASQHGGAFGAALARDGGNMLGYYALMHVLIGAVGSGAGILRLPSAIAGGATGSLTAAIALRLWDRATAVSAGALVAVSLSLVYWAQQARGYAAMVALATASFLAFLWLLEGGRRAPLKWAAYVALTTAAVYAGLEAALVIPAQLVALRWHRHRVGPVLAATATTAACCVPLAVLAVERGPGQVFWIPAPSFRIAKQVLQALTSSGLQPRFYTSAGDALLVLTLALLLVCGVGLMATLRSQRSVQQRVWGIALVLSWLLVPLAEIVVVSFTGHSIFQARYALLSLPAVSLAIAWTLRSAFVPRALAAALLVAVLVLRALALAPSYGVSTEYWRAATSSVAGRSLAGDCLVFYPQDTRMPFEYYGGHSGRLPPSVLPSVRWGRVVPFVERYSTLPARSLAALPSRCSRIWLVSSHEGRLGGPPVAGANFRRLQALRGALERLYPVDGAYRFGSASPISVTLYRKDRVTGAASRERRSVRSAPPAARR